MKNGHGLLVLKGQWIKQANQKLKANIDGWGEDMISLI